MKRKRYRKPSRYRCLFLTLCMCMLAGLLFPVHTVRAAEEADKTFAFWGVPEFIYAKDSGNPSSVQFGGRTWEMLWKDDDGLWLFSDVAGQGPFREEKEFTHMVTSYNGSYLQRAINGLKNNFNYYEKDHNFVLARVFQAKGNENEYVGGKPFSVDTFNYDIWPLSSDEVLRLSEAYRHKYKPDSFGVFWLRDRYPYDNDPMFGWQGAIFSSYVYYMPLNSPVAIRGSIMINPKKIRFVTPAGMKPGAEGPDMVNMKDATGNNHTFTLKDDGLYLKSLENLKQNDRAITFDYTGAQSGRTLSAAVLDKRTNEIRYFGTLVNSIPADGNGSASLTLPPDFNAAADRLVVFVEERYSGNCHGAGKEIEIPVSPVISYNASDVTAIQKMLTDNNLTSEYGLTDYPGWETAGLVKWSVHPVKRVSRLNVENKNVTTLDASNLTGLVTNGLDCKGAALTALKLPEGRELYVETEFGIRAVIDSLSYDKSSDAALCTLRAEDSADYEFYRWARPNGVLLSYDRLFEVTLFRNADRKVYVVAESKMKNHPLYHPDDVAVGKALIKDLLLDKNHGINPDDIDTWSFATWNAGFSNTNKRIISLSLPELSYGNTLKVSADLTKLTQLESLSCEGEYFTDLKVSGLSALEKITCTNQQLSSLDISGCTSLSTLQANGLKKLTQITGIDGAKIKLDTGGESGWQNSGSAAYLQIQNDNPDNVTVIVKPADGWYVESQSHDFVDLSKGKDIDARVTFAKYKVPNVPRDVKAVMGSYRGEVTLSWAAPEGGYAHTGYEATYDQWKTVISLGSEATSCTFTKLKSDSYTLKVRAVNADGQSPEASASAHLIPPDIARNVKATPGNTEATLSWEPPDSGGATTSYVVTCDGWKSFYTLKSSDTSYTFTGLEHGKHYQMGIRAVNLYGEGPQALADCTVYRTVLTVTFDDNGSGGKDMTDNDMKDAIEKALLTLSSSDEKKYINTIKLIGNTSEITRYNWRGVLDLYSDSGWGNLNTLDLSDMNKLDKIGGKTGIITTITKLSAVHLPAGLKTIGERAFYDCTLLQNIVFPENLETIGDKAFAHCKSLRTVTFPRNLQTLGQMAFYECYGLTDFVVDADNPKFAGMDGVLYNKEKSILHYYPAAKNSSSFSMPNSVEIIDSYAFYGCYTLQSIKFSKNLNTIEEYAFSGCRDFHELDFPDSLLTIGQYAFSGCSGIQSIIFSGNLPPEIEEWAFKYIHTVGTIYYPGKASGYTEDWKNKRLLLPNWTLTPFYRLTVVEGSDETNKPFYLEGERVQIKADSPPADAVFDKWTGGDDSIFVSDGRSKAETAITMPADDVTLTAVNHAHKYEGKWQHDDDKHWQLCSCGEAAEKKPHSGGSANCHEKAVCEICGVSYGSLDPDNHHGGTELRDEKAATEETEGYTGDTYCLGCGRLLETGEIIAKEEPPHTHNYEGEWHHDDTGHWQLCSCGEASEKKPHSGGSANCHERAVCEICHTAYGNLEPDNHHGGTELRDVTEATEDAQGYSGDTYCLGCGVLLQEGQAIPRLEPGHTHKYEGQWIYNDTGHWQLCSCAKAGDVSPHSGGTPNCHEKAVCEICGAAYGSLSPDSHSGGTELRNVRKATVETEGYTGDTYCLGCGQLLESGEVIPKEEPVHTHKYEGEWQHDDDSHWQLCSCGEAGEKKKHSGGLANCHEKAVCEICGTPYGNVNPDNHHGGTELRDERAATEDTEGYTGDTYCLGCRQLLAKGKAIPKKTPGHIHNYDGEWHHDDTGHWQLCSCGDANEKKPHSGGSANCHERAVCEICHTAYGNLEPDNHHGGTELRDVIEATEDAQGYSGDTYCLGCGVLLLKGQAIPRLEPGHTHKYEGEWIYNDTGHWQLCSCAKAGDVSPHSGGTPNCHEKSVCEICGADYGSLNPDTHSGGTELRNVRKATVETEGYTGDTYCLGCGQLLESGEVIPREEPAHTHKYEGKWQHDDDSHWQLCSCGEAGEKKKHSGGLANCHEKAVCEICGTPYGNINPDSHHGGTELRHAKAATEDAEGYTGDTYCLGCSQLLAKGKSIPKTAPGHIHKYDGEWQHDDTGHWQLCSCGKAGEKTAYSGTEVRNKKAATKDTEGYTGDTCCLDCGEVIIKGQVIPRLASPPTGDDSVLWLWLTLMLTALLGFGGLLAAKKRRR